MDGRKKGGSSSRPSSFPLAKETNSTVRGYGGLNPQKKTRNVAHTRWSQLGKAQRETHGFARPLSRILLGGGKSVNEREGDQDHVSDGEALDGVARKTAVLSKKKKKGEVEASREGGGGSCPGEPGWILAAFARRKLRYF